MFRNLRLKKDPPRVAVAADPGALSLAQLVGAADVPIALRTVNSLPEPARQRIYRGLLPPSLLARLDLNPITWKPRGGTHMVVLRALPESGVVNLTVLASDDPNDPAVTIELADNGLNGIDLNLLLLNDSSAERFGTDFDETGQPTYFGTVRRNRAEEARAMAAGLAPGQIRASLGASKLVVHQIDAFLGFLGHQALFLEPLTYASAWVFERRGFAYVRGHKLMQDIDKEFQPGGCLHAALDGSTPFRQPEQWRTVRGRAWAVHDGVLEVMGQTWNNLRMVKQVGRMAGVETAVGVVY
jgi:hypothetical protein